MIRSDNRLQTEIANDYGITKSAVSAIKVRKNWAHIALTEYLPSCQLVLAD
jgi:hypothetical protein